ncbi:dual specificity protein phosphatase 8-like [Pristis pectinata]|uniref:dual specificity protein phosphatase 8-like n=1 Tax=Pristis pectinata TaxID=685728 RepID=UPI00223E3B15|nr:dual specificity protein phosphatase 8-like [Pristis pectinata]
MAGDKQPVKAIKADELAAMLEGQTEKVLVIDCRPVADYSILHVLNAVNICTSMVAEGREWLTDLLQPRSLMDGKELVLYDQEAEDTETPVSIGNITTLLREVENHFSNVYFLKGGFVEFSSCFPSLCEGRSPGFLTSSLSQPCLSTCDVGPTQILPCFYLGSQSDVLNKELMVQNRITHILNVSSNCPKPAFIPDSHFLRIPVNDSYCDSLLPWLNKSVEFIDTVRSMQCRVLVHCLAGISRSAAIAIAYVMRTMNLSLDDAYRYVKDRRPTISPNFNFLGQLVEYEKAIQVQSSAHMNHSILLPDAASGNIGTPQPDTCEDPSEESPMFVPHFSTQNIPDQCLAHLDNATNNHPKKFGEGAPEMSSLHLGVTNLRLSPERAAQASCMKRSFSLDVKSAYPSSPHVGCYQTPQPAEVGPVPKLLGLGSKLVAGTFNPFTLLFGNARKARGKEDAASKEATQTLKAQQKCGGLQTPPRPAGLDQGLALSACPVHKKDGAPDNSNTRLPLTLPIPKQPKSPLLNYSTCLITVHAKRTELSLFDHPYSGPIKSSHVTGNAVLYTENMVKS